MCCGVVQSNYFAQSDWAVLLSVVCMCDENARHQTADTLNLSGTEGEGQKSVQGQQGRKRERREKVASWNRQKSFYTVLHHTDDHRTSKALALNWTQSEMESGRETQFFLRCPILIDIFGYVFAIYILDFIFVDTSSLMVVKTCHLRDRGRAEPWLRGLGSEAHKKEKWKKRRTLALSLAWEREVGVEWTGETCPGSLNSGGKRREIERRHWLL